MTLFALIVPVVLIASPPQKSECADVEACREAALAAASQKDFERFHDLAWRAVQKGRQNDPELMYLVARAQSLSGRPGDALVMLRRLAQMGVLTDARESDDFRAVRDLTGWAELEALLMRIAETPAPSVAPVAQRDKTIPPSIKAAPIEKPFARGAPSYSAAPAATTGADETVRLPENSIEPIGLAYDGASRRFVVGDRRANKLMVADEVFKRVNDLIGASSGGFGTLDALEIDGRRGDLWVASSNGEGVAMIHKLQLVSGRVLSRIDLPAEFQPAVISDLFVTDTGALWLLDSRGARLFRIKPAGGHVDRPLLLNLTSPSSMVFVGDIAYVAHDGGLSLIDLASGAGTNIGVAKGLTLSGIRRVRWDRGALIGIQTDDDGTSRLVRIRLARNGHLATAIDLLDASIDTEGAALTISRDAAYYVAHGPAGPIIRRVPLR